MTPALNPKDGQPTELKAASTSVKRGEDYRQRLLQPLFGLLVCLLMESLLLTVEVAMDFPRGLRNAIDITRGLLQLGMVAFLIVGGYRVRSRQYRMATLVVGALLALALSYHFWNDAN